MNNSKVGLSSSVGKGLRSGLQSGLQHGGLFALLLLSSVSVTQAGEEKEVSDALARGMLVKYGEKLVFAPCRERAYAFVEDVSGGKDVAEALGAMGLEDGKKMYVEFWGRLEGDSLKVNRLNFAQMDGRCQLSGGAEESWRGVGNTSPWSIGLGEMGVNIRTAEGVDLSFPPVVLQSEGAGFSGRVDGEAQHLELKLLPGLCRHDGRLFGWTMSMNLGGKRLEGCAWQR